MTTAAPKKDPTTGTWSFVVDVGAVPDGRRRQVRRRGFPTKPAAQEALDQLRAQARTRSYVPPARVSAKDYFDAWTTGLPARGIRPSTVDSYRRCSPTSRQPSGGAGWTRSRRTTLTGSTPLFSPVGDAGVVHSSPARCATSTRSCARP